MKKITKIEKATSKRKKILRVAAYCRVSTDTDAQLESLDMQKSHYERYINSRDDWQLAGIYYDEGISGTGKAARPELEHLISDCETGKIDLVITGPMSIPWTQKVELFYAA